jgi:predicted P-loop ATPase
MARPYSKIVTDYQRQYLHQVRLTNTGDWRSDHTGRSYYQVARDWVV